MPESDKKTKKRSELGVLAERSAAAQLDDRTSNKLRKSASSVGNEELKQRIESGKANRDKLLEFVIKRLRTVREVQQKEIGASSQHEQRSWWKDVADSETYGFDKPDPTRWRDVAKIYEEASYQMCRGALGRGRMLIERAIEKEKQTFGSLTKLVNTEDIDTEVEEPAVMEAVGGDDACPADNVPMEIKELAREIQLVTTKPPDPPGQLREWDPWWTLEEEEKEEEEGGGGESG